MTGHLASWNDGATMSAITEFVAAVTNVDSPRFVPIPARIATFDNDGTLWLEKPMYLQFQHGLRAIAGMLAQHPELADCQPFKAVHEHDLA